MIKINRLVKEFGKQVVLKGIDLNIPEGELLVIFGESGSGKSVLLQHMIGLMRPTRGSVEINGQDISKLTERELLKMRKNIGYLFQEGALYDFMTVSENVAFPLREHTRLKNKDIMAKVNRLLSMVGLKGAEHKFPSELSGGMKKRAALARSVIMDSKILFCDEPTSGLDPIKGTQIADLIRDMSKDLRSTTVITSHNVYDSFRIADRIVLIRDGQIIAAGTPAELRSNSDPYIKEFLRKG
jgi:phospholipid/cholesterol/gamma-HCH transport system ATP-binding protein